MNKPKDKLGWIKAAAWTGGLVTYAAWAAQNVYAHGVPGVAEVFALSMTAVTGWCFVRAQENKKPLAWGLAACAVAGAAINHFKIESLAIGAALILGAAGLHAANQYFNPRPPMPPKDIPSSSTHVSPP